MPLALIVAILCLQVAPYDEPDLRKLNERSTKQSAVFFCYGHGENRTVQIRNGRAVEVSPPNLRGDSMSSVSPDLRYLAFVKFVVPAEEDAIILLDLENNSIRELIRWRGYIECLAWSPRGNEIAFFGRILSGCNRTDMLGVVDLVTGEVTELARASSKLPPSWSPDGNKIIFSGFYRPEGADVGEMAIVVVIDRATKRALSLGKGYYPAWSPDGKLIAYLDHNRAIDGKQEHLCTMKPDGTGKAVLMSAGGWFLSRQELVGPFVWSPDMRFIAYHAQAGMKGGQRDLFILDLKTKKTKKIYSELDLVLFAWKSQYHPSRNTTNEVGG